MKFAAYLDDDIYAIRSIEAEALEEGRKIMGECEGTADEIAAVKAAPISDDLVAALNAAEASGTEVEFDIVNGVLVLAEAAAA